jgi:hypothetical protein
LRDDAARSTRRVTAMPSQPPQPLDEWDFLGDDDADDGDPAPGLAKAAEVAAMHRDARSFETPAEDPGVSDVALAAEGAEPVTQTYFSDEEPEGSPNDPVRPRAEPDDHEPDLEEILESQHYAFGPDPIEIESIEIESDT